MRKYLRPIMLLLIDMSIVAAAYYAAYWLRLELAEKGIGRYEKTFWATLPWLLSLRFLCGFLVRQYTWSFRHASLLEAVSLFKAGVVGSAIFIGLFHFGEIVNPRPPLAIYALEFAISLMGMGLVRFLPRYLYQLYLKRTVRLTANGELRLRTLIFGAGGTGELLLRDILRTQFYPYQVIGFVDDAASKWSTSIHGCRVLGGSQDLPELIRKHKIDQVLVAIPAISGSRLRKIVDLCTGHHVKFKFVPSFSEMVKRGDAGPITLKDIRPEDLLDRTPVTFDQSRMAAFFVDKTVLVTGAAGSIGAEICRQVCKHGVKHLVALDINENDLYFLELELEELAPTVSVHLEIANIRERERMAALFANYRPEIVFHAAAHKHVPLMEHCPVEALINNVLGTYNVADCARDHNTERFVLISTDKAVHPVNVMGASKRLAEFIVRDLGERSETHFMAVRFGNVLGSNGSLVPILQRQIAKGGPVTVTHPRITRYFMTISEAVGLVLVAAVQNEGTMCVLDMGEPLSVDQLARQMISLAGLIPEKDIKIVYTGLRAGEKMYEELFTRSERLTESSHPKIRIAHCAEEGVNVKDMLADLEKTVAVQDAKAVREFLLRYVPGYRPSTLPPVSGSAEASGSSGLQERQEPASNIIHIPPRYPRTHNG